MKLNSKKIIKIITVVMIIVMIATIASNVFAAPNPNTLKGDEVTTFNNLGKKIIGGIQAIGSIFSVAMLVVLGIKYMVGSAEEKAEYKKTMIPYVIGAVLVFAASNIASFIFNFGSSITA